MAEKGFGVKEINLIGASGTPTIESPNNLNLNAVNVAISTNVSIGGTLTISGSLSIGGTITYEDVTNVDSVGIITAREGIKIPDDKAITFGADGDGVIETDTSGNFLITGGGGNTGTTYVRGRSLSLSANGGSGGFNGAVTIDKSGDERVQLKYGSGTKLATTSSGITVTGTVAATAVTGDGSGLTGIAVTEAPVTDYTITGDGSNYYFHGGGVDETAGDPDLYLIRGQKYRFNNTTGNGHPFRFTSTGNKNDGYSNGVTGSENGIQFWTIPYDAPAKIFYVCTIHGGMVGNIYIRGAGGQNDNVGITTFSSHVDVTGNVDIGGGTHNRRLTVHDTTNSVILIEGASNGTSNLMFGDENDEDVGMLGYNHASNYLAFTVNTSERLRITSSGHSVHGGSVGIQTNNIDAANLSNPVGAGHSLVGLYIGDGSLLFSDQLARSGGYYITTGVNALNAGPVTLNSEMTLDGTWTIV